MKKPAALHIIGLEAQNIKKLRAVSVKPSTRVVRVSGANGSGKTSTLDAILWALAGARHVQMKPVRDGEERGHVKLEVGGEQVEYVIVRKFIAGQDGAKSTSSLTVEAPNGSLFPRPQAFLDQVLGSLSLDPLEFLRMDAAARLDALKKVVKIDVDLDELDRMNNGDFQRRTDVNRDLKRQEELVATYASGVNHAMKDLTLIPLQDLLGQMEQASAVNAEIDRQRQALEHGLAKIKSDLLEADRLRAQADALVTSAGLLSDRLHGLQQQIEARQPVDVGDLSRQVRDAERENSLRKLQSQQREKLAEAKSYLDALRVQSEKLTAQIEYRSTMKAEAIAKAEFPVEGMSLTTQGIFHNGVPFEQASGAEQLRVSFAIAVATKPKLPVVLIKDGSLLDDKSMTMLEDLAEKYDAQVWIERVGRGSVGIVLEDGEVVAVDGVATDGADA